VTAVIFNPTARGDHAVAFQRQLAGLSPGIRLLPTRSPGDATRLALEAALDGATTVVAAGGDGTVNEVVNGLADRPDAQRPSLGVIPLGTVNVFAKELGLPNTIPACWNIIQSGHSRLIDLALARHAGGSRWFIQMAGAGLDAIAIARVHLPLKRLIGPGAYLWAGLGAIVRPLPTIQIRIGPESVSGQLALVGNGRFYGGRFSVFPQAHLDDGRLDLAVLNRAHPFALARAGIAAFRGRLLQHPGVVHRQSTTFDFSGPVASPFQVEGDNIGTLPVSFTVAPSVLRVLCQPVGPG
jgi:diacylglycerol kinase (ATP)